MQKHIPKAAAKAVNTPLTTKVDKPAATRPRFKHEQPPDKFTYALAAYTAERRKDGYYVTKTVPSARAGRAPCRCRRST